MNGWSLERTLRLELVAKKVKNEWSELGAEIKVGAWSEQVKNEWSELEAPK